MRLSAATIWLLGALTFLPFTRPDGQTLYVAQAMVASVEPATASWCKVPEAKSVIRFSITHFYCVRETVHEVAAKLGRGE